MVTMKLSQQKCVPCRGGVPPMKRSLIKEYIKKVNPGWRVKHVELPGAKDGEGAKIVRRFTFKNFAAALEFVNQVGAIAEGEDHHPNIHLTNWNKVKLVLFTHKINGLHANDFILAAKIDKLAHDFEG